MCKKENLQQKDFKCLEELAKDSQVDLNFRSEEEGHYGRTPLMLLICPEDTNTIDGKLLKCTEILLQRKDIDTILKDDTGSTALTLLCQHYQGNDLKEVLHLLIHHDIRGTKMQQNDDRLKDWSMALLNLCQFHKGESLKGAMRLIIDCDERVLGAKKGNATFLQVLQSRSSEQNRSINLIKIARFLVNRYLQWIIFNGQPSDEMGETYTAFALLCSTSLNEIFEMVGMNDADATKETERLRNTKHLKNLFQRLKCDNANTTLDAVTVIKCFIIVNKMEKKEALGVFQLHGDSLRNKEEIVQAR